MYEAKDIHDWSLTSQIVALHVNMNRKRGSRAVTYVDVHPYKSRLKREIRNTAVHDMKSLKSEFMKATSNGGV